MVSDFKIGERVKIKLYEGNTEILGTITGDEGWTTPGSRTIIVEADNNEEFEVCVWLKE